MSERAEQQVTDRCGACDHFRFIHVAHPQDPIRRCRNEFCICPEWREPTNG